MAPEFYPRDENRSIAKGLTSKTGELLSKTSLRVGANLLGRNLDGNQIAWKLVMDEPANDLDIETLELLESLLADYQGTVLLVSHDRAFLNDVVTSTLVIEDDGLVKEHEAGYDDDLRQRPAEAASQSRPSPDVPRKKAADAPCEQPRKLSLKERKKLDGMPGRMEQLEKTAQGQHAALAGPSFHRQDRDEIAGAKKRLEDLERDLAAAYARWHALEELAG